MGIPGLPEGWISRSDGDDEELGQTGRIGGIQEGSLFVWEPVVLEVCFSGCFSVRLVNESRELYAVRFMLSFVCFAFHRVLIRCALVSL
jgi:hypothetical protein